MSHDTHITCKSHLDVRFPCPFPRLWHQKLEQEAGGMVDSLLRGTGHEVSFSPDSDNLFSNDESPCLP